MGKNKSAVTIMDRHYMGDDPDGQAIYMFVCNHVAVGIIDEKDNIFVDVNGNEYEPLGEDFSMSENPKVYANAIKLSDLKSNVESTEANLTMRDKISIYEYEMRKYLYYVGKNDDGSNYYMVFNKEKLKDNVKDVIEEAKNTDDGQLDIEGCDFDEGLRQLIDSALAGKYSVEELERIVNNLNEGAESLMDTVEALDYQLSAMKNKTSYSEEAKKAQKRREENKKEFEKKAKVKVEEEKEVKEEKVDVIDIDGLYKKVTKTLIAQDEPTRRVIVELARKFLDERKRKEGLLLAGPTGVGKTKMMELIAKYIDVPFLPVDTSQLTVAGYVGKDIEEFLWDLYIKSDRNLDRCENAIVYFDEIDKKGSEKNTDVNNKGVLNLLLKFIEGTTYDAYPDSKKTEMKIKINTSNMIVILGGAFTDVYKNLHVKNNIGFSSDKESVDTLREAQTKDFVEYGHMSDEFMGRVVIVKLNDLSVEDLKRVLLEGDESATKIQKEIFEKIGVKVKFTDDYIEAVAKKAYEKKTGARGLAGIVDQSTWPAFDEACCNVGGYSSVVFDADTVEDNKKYKLNKKRKK